MLPNIKADRQSCCNLVILDTYTIMKEPQNDHEKTN